MSYLSLSLCPKHTATFWCTLYLSRQNPSHPSPLPIPILVQVTLSLLGCSIDLLSSPLALSQLRCQHLNCQPLSCFIFLCGIYDFFKLFYVSIKLVNHVFFPLLRAMSARTLLVWWSWRCTARIFVKIGHGEGSHLQPRCEGTVNWQPQMLPFWTHHLVHIKSDFFDINKLEFQGTKKQRFIEGCIYSIL